MFGLSISPCPVHSSVPVTASALLSVPQHLTDVTQDSKYVFPQKNLQFS